MSQPNTVHTTAAPRAGGQWLARVRAVLSPRIALALSLVIAWLNFLLTSRWATVGGSLHGWRRPYYVAVLALASLLAAKRTAGARSVGRALPRVAAAGCAALLATAFFSWFPPSTWTQIPFADNWPPRFQSTVEAVALLSRGAVGGWQWAFLGGYHTVSDITQNLAVLGFLPILIFGPTLGFHLLHALLFAAIPLLVFVDLADEDRDVAWLAAGFCAVLAGNFSYMFMRSGDTNSVAGVACTTLALVGSHLARRGRWWGTLVLVGGLTLTAYSHIGFLAYAVVYLALEAIYYKDRRSAVIAAAAFVLALVGSLPLTWEIWWRFPGYFTSNNLGLHPADHTSWLAIARKVYYNAELLVRPGRWANDYTGVTAVFLPVLVLVAIERRTRAGFYALAALATVAMLRLNAPEFGYVFLRPMHMFVVATAVPLAWFIVHRIGTRTLAVVLVVLLAIFVQITFVPVPHVRDIRSFDAPLVDRIASVPGAMVLVENNPHRNMNDRDPDGTERSAFGVHFESLLPAATGKRFYAGYWDGWQWSPWRGQTVAGGTFQGEAIARTPAAAFAAEMRRWGIVHLLVWSTASHAYLDAHPAFVRAWSEGRWTDYTLSDPDPREVAVEGGRGELHDVNPLGANVSLSGVHAGTLVVVRTNYYPAWTATCDGKHVAVVSAGGQMAFYAPKTGDYEVELRYPRRGWLSASALAVLLAGASGLAFAVRRKAATEVS